MVTVSIKNRNMDEEEKIALEKLLAYIKNEFSYQIIAEHEVDSENINFLQIFSKKTFNSRGAGRNTNIDNKEICDYALNYPQYNVVEIDYFNCSKQYIYKVLNDNNVIYQYKKMHKLTK